MLNHISKSLHIYHIKLINSILKREGTDFESKSVLSLKQMLTENNKDIVRLSS